MGTASHRVWILLLGQFLSLFGTALSSFAMSVWIWRSTQRAESLVWLEFWSFFPVVAGGLFAGPIIDRFRKRRILAIIDVGSLAVTGGICLLQNLDALKIWNLYAARAFLGFGAAFYVPTFYIVVSRLLPVSSFARAAGVVPLALSSSGVLAPYLSERVLAGSGLSTVLMLDGATAMIACLALTVCPIGELGPTARPTLGLRTYVADVVVGYRFILARPGLCVLQGVFLINNFLTLINIVFPAMVLARTGSVAQLAEAQSAGATGGLFGSVALMTWRMPSKRVRYVLAGMMLSGLLGQALGGLAHSVGLLATSAFFRPSYIHLCFAGAMPSGRLKSHSPCKVAFSQRDASWAKSRDQRQCSSLPRWQMMFSSPLGEPPPGTACDSTGSSEVVPAQAWASCRFWPGSPCVLWQVLLMRSRHCVRWTRRSPDLSRHNT